MSHVNNYIVTFSCAENADTRAKEMNEFLQSIDSAQRFREDMDDRTDYYGGTKVSEIGLLIGAFNYVAKDELCAAVESARWAQPEYVQVFCQAQWDDKVRELDWRAHAEQHRIWNEEESE